jgi:hypothetical protein
LEKRANVNAILMPNHEKNLPGAVFTFTEERPYSSAADGGTKTVYKTTLDLRTNNFVS